MTMTKTTKLIALAGLALPLALGLTACDDESAHPPLDDVDSGWTCAHEDGVVRASGAVTNHSSKASFYAVTVSFSADGVQYATGSTTVDEVGPGRSARLEVTSDEEADGDLTCAVTEVERFKA